MKTITNPVPSKSISFSCLFAAMLLVLSACTTPSLKDELLPAPESFAREPATEGMLWTMAEGVMSQYGSDHSGFKLLDGSYDALAARLALFDSAVSSLDVQTYLWYPDNSGRLLLERAVEAAKRGVQVRLIIDDLLTIGLDQVIYELNEHPNIEIRLFNPWKDRSVLARGGQMIAEMERLNQRMHDKLVIADGNAAIIGGRNIGDHYFGLNHDYNFHDIDVIGFGNIARQSNAMFDSFWNSEWVVSAINLDTEPDPEIARERWVKMQEKNRASAELQAFGTEPSDWSDVLRKVAAELHVGTSRLVYDEATGTSISQNVLESVFPFMNEAQSELLVTNAYIIPGQPAIDFVNSLTKRGVRVRILTNSLESHDVPAVNSHYRDWRDDFIEAGAELFELRADAAIQSIVDVPPVEAEFVGLHSKALVVDRSQVFIGSMNFDPRSAQINTEMGAFIYSPGLAEELAQIMERDMLPENAWQVLLDDKGKPYWTNNDRTVYKQPARSSSQRIMDKIFKVVPKEQY